MSDQVLLKGYLSKRAANGENLWRKRYFVLYSDGRIDVSDKKGAAARHTYVLTSQSRISSIPADELKNEKGFYVTFKANDVLCVKSAKKQEVDQWDGSIRAILAKIGSSMPQSRSQLTSMSSNPDMQRLYSKAENNPKLQATISRNKRAVAKIPGAVMKVGESSQAGDFFVNTTTWEYFSSEQDCMDGQQPLGKATLNLLV